MKNGRKVILNMILVLMIVGVCLVIGDGKVAEAKEEQEVLTSGNYDYVILEDGTAEIVKYSGHGSSMVVPLYINNIKVSTLGRELYFGFATMYHVDIPDGVREIKSGVFNSNTALEKVVLPYTIKKIGDEAFGLCFVLNKINLPDSLEELNSEVFAYTRKLKELKFPKELKYIRDNAFIESGLYRVVLGEKIKKIEKKAFAECLDLDSMVILSKDVEIDETAIPVSTKLYGYVGSTVEKFAKERGNEFVEFHPINSIKLSEEELILEKEENKQVQLSAIITPSSAKYQKIEWTSSNEKVAVVDVYGNVKPIGNGSTIITAKAVANSNVSTSCKVTVNTRATGINIDSKDIILDLGRSTEVKKEIKTTVYPKDSNITDIKWSTSDSKIATVDQYGIVTAVSNGKCIVSAKVSNSEHIGLDSCEVTVITSPNRIGFDKSELNLVQWRTGSDNYTLKATVLPVTSGVTGSYIWSSSNDSIASVDQNGTVRAKGIGTAYITAILKSDRTIIGRCKVVVRPKPSTISIEKGEYILNTKTNASVIPSIKVQPSNATDYKIIWNSSNPKVATVNSSGKVTAKGEGNTVITGKVDGIVCSYTVFVVPNKISSINLLSRTSTSIRIKWSSVKGATEYIISRKESGQSTYSHKVRTTKNEFTDKKGIKSGTKYTYRIVPVLKVGKEERYGSAVTYTTASKPSAPTIAKGIKISKNTKKGIQISWKKVSKVSGYVVYMSTNKNKGYEKVGETEKNTVNFSKYGLKQGKTYYFKVKAYIVLNNSRIYSDASKYFKIKR